MTGNSIMAVTTFDLELLHRVPEVPQSGILYACLDCNVVVHLCACGCGEKVVLQIDPNFWKVDYDGESLSLHPSIGNFQYPCKSHYWIRKNKVIWADAKYLTPSQTHQKTTSKKLSFFNRIKTFLHWDDDN